jgi:hypothetical protein
MAREGRLGKAAGEGMERAERRESKEADCAVRDIEASCTEAGGHEESGGAGAAVEIILIYCSERRSL